jgi:hypothetical protein
MVVSSVATRAAASSGGGGSGGAGGSNNSTSGLYYPYAVPASLYPTPANLSLSARVEAVASVPFPGASSAYAVVVASTSASQSGGNSSLVLWEAAFSPQDARSIALNSTCGEGCGQLPLSWSNLSRICTLPGPVADVELVAVGSMLVVAATSEGYTYLFSDSLPAESWSFIGPVLPGTVSGLSGASDEVAIATTTSTAVYVATVAASGATLGEVTVYSTSSNLTGPVDASVSLIPEGAGYSEVVVYSIAGSDHIEVTSSSTGSQFSTPTVVGNFSTSVPDSLGVPLGQTVLSTSGGEPGQLVLTAVGSELFLLFTTDEGGQTVPMTAASGNGGVTWDGPYLSGAINGSALNPAVTSSPAGLVYAAWTDPDYGTGAIEEAEYLADGMPILAPETVGSGLFNGTVPTGPATLAVDSFQRPLLLWPSSPSSGNGSVAYTGAYLGVSASLNLTEVAANLSLGEWDLKQAAQGGSALASLGDDVNLDVASVDGAMTSGNLCAAQNLTALSLYSNLTHVALSVSSGLGTVCAATFVPDLAVSPLLNATGIDEPNTYLAVYLDWALEAEGVPISASPLTAVTQFSPYALEGPSATLPSPVSNSETVNSSKASVTVTPTPYSPSAYDLVVSDSLPTWSELGTSQSCNLPDPSPKVTTTYTTSVTSTWTNVSIDNGTVHTFNGTTSYPSVWIYDLPEDQGYSWSATVYATTSETREVYDGCTGSTTYTTVSPVSVGPKSIPAMTVRGSFATTLTLTYGTNLLTAAFNGNDSAAQLSARFNATLPATSNLTVSNGTERQSSTTGTPVIASIYTFPSAVGVNRTYTLSIDSVSRGGSSSEPGSPALAYSDSGVAPPEQINTSCSFTLTPSAPTVWNATNGPFESLNATTANVTWYSSAYAPGFITYNEASSPINWTVSGIRPSDDSNGTWVYTVELHGLEPLVSYNATFGVSWHEGCLVEEDQRVSPQFETSTDPSFSTDPTLPSVWERDLPYDTLTQTGGGVVIGWDTPSNKTLGNGTHTYLGGYIQIWNSSGTPETFPLTASEVLPSTTKGGSQVSLDPPLGINQRYNYEVVANYTYDKVVKSHGKTTYENSTESAKLTRTFTYEIGTSGDGLTDAEKSAGWYVPLPQGSATQVTASNSDFATNGLVDDYLEKELDLDPKTLDSAGSHMLDTWNLTFYVGPANGSKALVRNSTYFEYFYDNQSYHFDPSAVNETNLTCVNLGVTCLTKKWVGDSSPWASKVLWSASSLTNLMKLMKSEDVGWLRATTGTYGKDLIMTVWGKLSWGADPLAQSTSNDGYADGAQTDPRGPDILEVTFNSWEVNNSPVDEYGGSFTGVGSAPRLTVETEPSPRPGFVAGTVFYGGDGSLETGFGPSAYPLPGEAGYSDFAQADWNGPYEVAIPIASESQTLYWNVSMWTNNSLDLGDDEPAFFLSNTSWNNLSLLDLNQTHTAVVPLYNLEETDEYQTPPSLGYVSISFEILPPQGKVNTLLVVPANNTTLSLGPWGVTQYTGEPDFDLLVLNLTNASSPLTVSGIAGAEGGWSYDVTLDPGLNNLLVPRTIFINSPLGQALLNNTNDTVPIPSGAGVTFHAVDWSGRAEANNTTNPQPDKNTSNPNFIWVVSNSTCQLASSCHTAGGFGGVPTDPQVGTTDEARQVQAVVWANISATKGYANPSNWSDNLSTGASEFRDLLGGLVMGCDGNWTVNNTSGVPTQRGCSTTSSQTWGLANNVVDATSTLWSLNLPQSVLSVLANATLPSDGSYGPPVFHFNQSADYSQPGWFWQDLTGAWNTITGVFGWIANETGVGVVWSATIAAAAYLQGLVGKAGALVSRGLSWFAHQVASVLGTVAHVMWTALGDLLDWLWSEVSGMISNATSDVTNAFAAYASTVGQDFSSAESAYVSSGSVPGAISAQFWNDFAGSVFLDAFGAAATILIVLFIITPFTLGASFVIGVIVGLIISAVLLADEDLAHPDEADLDSITTINAPAARAVEATSNSTNPPDQNSSNYSLSWGTLAELYDLLSGLVSTLTLGPLLLGLAYFQGVPIVLPSVNFALGLISLGLTLDAWKTGSNEIAWIGVGVSGTGVGLDFYQSATHGGGSFSGPVGAMNAISIGLDTSAFAIGLVQALI